MTDCCMENRPPGCTAHTLECLLDTPIETRCDLGQHRDKTTHPTTTAERGESETRDA